MNIYVCIKQVPDTETRIKIAPDKNWIDTAGIKWIMSPYDELAVEEALRLKEKNPGSTVVAVSAGPARVPEAIRTALAMGADTGIHIETPETSDGNLAAKALAAALKKEPKIDIIFTGKEAIDDGAAQTSQLLARYLGIPAVTSVQNIEYLSGSLKCKREIEGGSHELVETPLPAVVAAQKGLNDPRYASLPNIMKAKKKEIRKLTMAELGVSESDQKIRFKNFEPPPAKQAGKKIKGAPEEIAKELVRLLRDEAKVV